MKSLSGIQFSQSLLFFIILEKYGFHFLITDDLSNCFSIFGPDIILTYFMFGEKSSLKSLSRPTISTN